MIQVVFGRPPQDDIAALLDQIPDSDLRSITRSTVPLLAYWKHPESQMRALREKLQLPESSNASLAFEYPVPCGVPRSKPSCTDVMYIAKECRIAVEAKWTERRYHDIGHWLAAGKVREHRARVLERWLERIRPFAQSALREEQMVRVVYQMLHRTASACDGRPPNAAVVYQCFADDRHQHNETRDDLCTLARALQPREQLRLYFARINIERTGAFRALQHRFKRYTKAQKAAALRLAIWDEELFSFSPERLELVRP